MQNTQAQQPPLARGLPFIGSAFGLMGDVRAFLTERYLELGPVFRVNAFNRHFTVMAGPEANLFVARDGRECLGSGEFWSDFTRELGANRLLMGMDGADHVRLRKAQRWGYSRSLILENIAEVVDITRREVWDWPVDTPVPAVYALQRIATDQIGTLAAGISPREYLDDIIVFVRTLLMARVTRHRTALSLYAPRFRRARRRIEELRENVRSAHESETSEGESHDLIDDLLALSRADPEFMPENDLAAATLGPFIAGLDTVGSTCAFMLYALLKRPDLVELITQEADALFADGTPSADSLRQLDITHRAAMETLRMYPIAPALTRTATRDFEFGSYRILKGENIIVATTVSHYLPELFPNPERFDIDRYDAERREHRQPGAFAPFGAGPHICLGAGFAEVSIAVTMATIFHYAQLELVPPDYELNIDHAPTPSPDDNFRFRVKRLRRDAASYH